MSWTRTAAKPSCWPSPIPRCVADVGVWVLLDPRGAAWCGPRWCAPKACGLCWCVPCPVAQVLARGEEAAAQKYDGVLAVIQTLLSPSSTAAARNRADQPAQMHSLVTHNAFRPDGTLHRLGLNGAPVCEALHVHAAVSLRRCVTVCGHHVCVCRPAPALPRTVKVTLGRSAEGGPSLRPRPVVVPHQRQCQRTQ